MGKFIYNIICFLLNKKVGVCFAVDVQAVFKFAVVHIFCFEKNLLELEV